MTFGNDIYKLSIVVFINNHKGAIKMQYLAIYMSGFDGYELHAYSKTKSDVIEMLHKASLKLDPNMTKSHIKENTSFYKLKDNCVFNNSTTRIMEV